jgi:Coenzyme PQQ synthesis protein D (PqqD)
MPLGGSLDRMVVRVRSNAVEWREVEGEIVALDLRTQTYLSINGSGAAIWPALVAGAEREALIAGLIEKFSVSEDQAAADLDAFLAQLDEQGLLE